MKPMVCDKFLEEVMTPEKPLGAAAAAHVRECPACAALRADAERLASGGVCEMEPPAELDRAVMSHAHNALRRRAVHRLFFRRVMPFAAAAAAAVVCVAVLLPEDAPAAGPEVRIAQNTVRPADGTAWNTLEKLEKLESEAFEISQELTSCQYVVADWQTM